MVQLELLVKIDKKNSFIMVTIPKKYKEGNIKREKEYQAKKGKVKEW